MKIYGEQLIVYRALLEERQAWETKYVEDNLRDQQLKTAGLGFLYWLIPVILLYLIGMGAAWVRKGK